MIVQRKIETDHGIAVYSYTHPDSELPRPAIKSRLVGHLEALTVSSPLAYTRHDVDGRADQAAGRSRVCRSTYQ